MANINSIKTDLNKENEGAWVDYVLGIRLKIARSRNPKYQELLRSITAPKIIEIREDKMELEDFNKLMAEVRAKTILLGWENIEDTDGKPIPYSSVKALEFFKNPELKDFYKFVVAVSENADQYKKELVEASEKNS